MARMKEQEVESARLRKMYVEEKIKAEIVCAAPAKKTEAIYPPRDGQRSSSEPGRVDPPRCEAFGVSQTGYRYERQRNAGNERIADWLLRLTDNHRNWGFGLCFLDLRNVKGFGWNHKRVYWIYRELELNLRIKPRKLYGRRRSR
ncbi:hypothetical protein BGLA2_1510027 [Burkholderia gladioli]|nr:hypothetical protein BGLA2_1510027 [Burkholderia gladioli]